MAAIKLPAKTDKDFITFVEQQFSHLRNRHGQYHKKTIDRINKLQSDCNDLQNYQNKIKAQYNSLSEFMNDDVEECKANILQRLNRVNNTDNEVIEILDDNGDHEMNEFIQNRFTHLQNEHNQYHRKVIAKMTKQQIKKENMNDNIIYKFVQKLQIDYDLLREFMNDEINECETRIINKLKDGIANINVPEALAPTINFSNDTASQVSLVPTVAFVDEDEKEKKCRMEYDMNTNVNVDNVVLGILSEESLTNHNRKNNRKRSLSEMESEDVASQNHGNNHNKGRSITEMKIEDNNNKEARESPLSPSSPPNKKQKLNKDNIKIGRILIKNVEALDNPAPLINDIKLRVTFKCISPGIKGELDWKLVYVGSPGNEQNNQELDSFATSAIKVGLNRFTLTTSGPDITKIPDLFGRTSIILTCSYNDQLFHKSSLVVDIKSEGFEAINYREMLIEHYPEKIIRNICTKESVSEQYKIVWYDEGGQKGENKLQAHNDKETDEKTKKKKTKRKQKKKKQQKKKPDEKEVILKKLEKEKDYITCSSCHRKGHRKNNKYCPNYHIYQQQKQKKSAAKSKGERADDKLALPLASHGNHLERNVLTGSTGPLSSHFVCKLPNDPWNNKYFTGVDNDRKKNFDPTNINTMILDDTISLAPTMYFGDDNHNEMDIDKDRCYIGCIK